MTWSMLAQTYNYTRCLVFYSMISMKCHIRFVFKRCFCSIQAFKTSGYNIGSKTSHSTLLYVCTNLDYAMLLLLLLLLLSRFSRARLCATPEMAAHQAPPSLGFSRQEHWSGLPCPSPMHEVKSESEVAQSCPTVSDPMDCSPPGSSVHGIFQARVLEWGAIAFSVHYVRY